MRRSFDGNVRAKDIEGKHDWSPTREYCKSLFAWTGPERGDLYTTTPKINYAINNYDSDAVTVDLTISCAITPLFDV